MSLWSSSKVALLHPECGMTTVLVRVAKASRMIVIFRASHEDRFHRTPVRRGTKRETGDPPVDGYEAEQTHQFWLLSACADSSTNRTNMDADAPEVSGPVLPGRKCFHQKGKSDPRWTPHLPGRTEIPAGV